MNLAWIILLDLLLIYFIFGHSLVRRFYTRRRRNLAELRDYEKHFSHILIKDRDILPEDSLTSLESAIAELRTTRREGDDKAVATMLQHYHTDASVILPSRSNPRLRDHLEVMVVALGLAFGVRALFLQPFKIPTGSMQPTLFGIHFSPSEAPLHLNPAKRLFDYINYTKRYIDVQVRAPGYIDLQDIRKAKPAIPFLPSSLVDVGDQTYKLPGAPVDVQKYLQQLHGRGAYLRQGDVLARGALLLGDHLFVDRTYLAFHEPKRGDVTVFVTDGITYRGRPLSGRFYIKRLVGLPGDTLKIQDGRLYVKEPGATEFRLVDQRDSKGFPRIYSMKGGYHGYTHLPQSQLLTDDTVSYTVPEGQYFMMGDNSLFSLDSRFWKTVPRKNLVGRAFWVWWPFDRRWGRVDHCEPRDFDTMSRLTNPYVPPILE